MMIFLIYLSQNNAVIQNAQDYATFIELQEVWGKLVELAGHLLTFTHNDCSLIVSSTASPTGHWVSHLDYIKCSGLGPGSIELGSITTIQIALFCVW